MSSNRHRRDDYYGDLEHRKRNRDRRRSRSRSRSPERYHRRRRSPGSRSRSRSRDRSSGRHYSNRGEKASSTRYTSSSRRQSMSRSRSKSRTRRNSRSHSPFSHSRPTNSYNSNSSSSGNSRPSAHGSEYKFERTSQRQATETHSSNRKESESHEHDNKSSNADYTEYSVEDLPLPKKEAVGAYYNLNTEEPIDKERIHREMEEKLRATLAKEGKVYPPPKPEPSHPVFANDGSFIEIFKKMQQAQQSVPAAGVGLIKPVITQHAEASTSNAAVYVAAAAAGKPAPPPLIVGRRRGGKILKTGLVAKPKAQGEDTNDPKDFWTIYLREVNKYKNNACDSDGGTRPLVK